MDQPGSRLPDPRPADSLNAGTRPARSTPAGARSPGSTPAGPRSAGALSHASFLTAPAKINLALEVVGRRADGFHELRSIFAPLVLADDLRVSVRPGWEPPTGPGAGIDRGTGIDLGTGAEPRAWGPRAQEPGSGADGEQAPGSGAAGAWPVASDDRAAAGPGMPAVRDHLAVSGAPDVPVSGNLVLRAALLLRAETEQPLPPLAFSLRKRIPAAAGLGGGSSDAMAALDLATAAWGLRLSRRRRVELAAVLGSDVPYFAFGGWALVTGRGERLVRLPSPRGGPLGVLLVVPAARLATRDVFAAFDAMSRAPRRTTRGRVEGPGTGKQAEAAGTPAETAARPGAPRPRNGHSGAVDRLAALLRGSGSVADVSDTPPANDLLDAAAAQLPGLDRLRRELGELLGRPVHITGSGPTLFVLYASPRDARRAASAVRAAAAAGALRPPGGTLQAIATATEGDDT